MITSEIIRRSNSGRQLRLMSPSKEWEEYVNKFFISHEMFEEILSVYENNILYYCENMDIEGINQLEYWFMHVIEPPPRLRYPTLLKQWIEKEETKLLGHSYYCLQRAQLSLNMTGFDFSTIKSNLDAIKGTVERT